MEARTHLQLGSVLYHHTRNGDQARGHLEKAWLISQQIPQFEDVKFEAASLLSELYCQENSVDTAKPLLRKAIQISQQTPYWHCRLLFQLAVSDPWPCSRKKAWESPGFPWDALFTPLSCGC
ncbi:MAU2 chromatid cohesion factor homolog [Corapipo altera]|uniref:MAU2 chromatid cohesion factor homolog n=1 Tax=Corapipo altera TaxID=415028 RepID=UPI000FD67B3A|nr:MAU2 chromatid cohesion factor homolog [Corapipo altera]